MFSVVKFKIDSSVQVVPSSWLSTNKGQCKWPPGPCKDISADIRAVKKPGDHWPLFDIRIFKSTSKKNQLI